MQESKSARRRDLALRLLAADLRQLADKVESLCETDDLAADLATVVTSLIKVAGPELAPLELGYIADGVCAALKVNLRDLRSPLRTQHIAHARQLAMYLMREITECSYPRIGDFFGRDHSTAIHGCQRIAARAAAEPAFRKMIADFKHKLLIDPIPIADPSTQSPPTAASALSEVA